MNYFAIPGLSARCRQTATGIGQTAQKIVARVASYYGFEASELLLSNQKERSMARQVAMYLIIESGSTARQAGGAVSRDRSTAVYAYQKVKGWLSMHGIGGFYAKIQGDIETIKSAL